MQQDDARRFWSKVEVRSSSECWPWTAGRSRKGYGRFKLDGRKQRAHRVAWQDSHGPIPPGMHILHSCDNPPCVNPAHLRAGSNKDNMEDKAARLTHCKHGHPFDEENTCHRQDGRRSCRACQKRWRAIGAS